MDEKQKPLQERLKSEVELKVSDAGWQSHSPETSSVETDSTNQSEPDCNTPEPSAEPPNAVSARDIRVAVLAERKAKEQAFLAEYKQKQLRTRIKFIACAAVFLSLFWSSMYFVCSKSAKASAALTQFQPVAVFACLGERDMAYFTMSGFSQARGEPEASPKLVEQRTKILEHSIKEQEANGRSAIFTRLGAEQMLIQHGDRDTALKFGDPLIAKYPDLPSNYFWRAKIDFDHLDFANAVKDYKKTAEIISRSPEQVGQSFYTEYVKAIWACINTGQFDEANRFLDLASKYGLNEYDRDGLRSQILISKSDALAVSDLKDTDFWTKNIASYDKTLLTEARQIAQRMDYTKALFESGTISDIQKFDLTFSTAVKLNNWQEAKTRAAEGWSKSYRARMEATIALAEGKPELALQLIDKYRDLDYYYEKKIEMIAAEALLKSGQPLQAIQSADRALEMYITPAGLSTGKYYLPFRIIKAKALYKAGRYDQAIAESNKILAVNPHLIAPQIVKIDALDKLKNFQSANEVRKALQSELSQVTAESGNQTKEQGRK